ncbi:MAG: hypothetical protein B9S34_13600 [Opitutia bacterium Tous-C1TDCM]|nr:MAG: hypothetical protein B9S34_13600 [Opitutae bacterium Tous-C1TDCM]
MTAPASAKTILLAEDDDLIREVTVAALEAAGYRVVAVPDGAEALAAMVSVAPDLILSDVRMPNCDGFELLERIQGRPQLADTPFIIVSAKAETADQRRGMSLGADDYVMKPYQTEDLLRTIELRLQRAERVRQLSDHRRNFLTRVLPHELRTPLTGVLGYADLLTMRGEMNDPLSSREHIEFGGYLRRSGERLLRVAEDFSLWAALVETENRRRDGGTIVRATVPLEIGVLAKWCDVALCEAGRVRDFTLDAVSGAVVVLPQGLPLVVRHLVENACKFSVPGTPIRVSGRPVRDFYAISVVDEGRGMTEAEIAAVAPLRQFRREQFEQQGLGLGLLLAREYARACGGEFLLFANAPAPGLTARIVLPLADVGR